MKSSGSSLRVLIAGENPDFLAVTKAWLERHPRIESVRIAGMADAAIEAAAAGDVDLILIDAVMPDMDGFEATRVIKSAAEPPLVAILVMFDYAAVREEARLAGADACVDKSALTQDLATLLEGLQPSTRRPGRRPGSEL